MKKQKTAETSGAGQKRAAEEDVLVPTLGQVAGDADFERLRELIAPVARRPVNELSEALRAELLDGQDKPTRLCLQAFFAACVARAGEIERKRAHMTSGEQSPGKRERRMFFFVCPFATHAATLCVRRVRVPSGGSRVSVGSSSLTPPFRELVVLSVEGGARAVRADQGCERHDGEHAG